MENKKFYAVTKGEYSDYHIITITDDEETAYKLKAMYSDDYSEAKVEVFENGLINTAPYWWINVGTNGIAMAKIVTIDDWLYPIEELNIVMEDDDIFYVLVNAKDCEHAKKIAYDLITKYKAEKAGI